MPDFQRLTKLIVKHALGRIKDFGVAQEQAEQRLKGALGGLQNSPYYPKNAAAHRDFATGPARDWIRTAVLSWTWIIGLSRMASQSALMGRAVYGSCPSGNAAAYRLDLTIPRL
jgi:hypothetical protein